MIPAGTLRYKLTFYEEVETQTDSGFIQKVKTEIYVCKAAKVKSSGSFNENAKEQFHSNTTNYKVRYNKLINENQIVKIDNQDYNILFLDRNLFDNSLLITVEKLNI